MAAISRHADNGHPAVGQDPRGLKSRDAVQPDHDSSR
jgi:hypothetical protein